MKTCWVQGYVSSKQHSQAFANIKLHVTLKTSVCQSGTKCQQYVSRGSLLINIQGKRQRIKSEFWVLNEVSEMGQGDNLFFNILHK